MVDSDMDESDRLSEQWPRCWDIGMITISGRRELVRPANHLLRCLPKSIDLQNVGWILYGSGPCRETALQSYKEGCLEAISDSRYHLW